MTSADDLVTRIEQSVNSDRGRDDVLRDAVRILKAERELYHWVGIYLLEGEVLVLHNYLGKETTHTRIPVGLGVCGTAIAEKKNQIIGDVRNVNNYLACSLEARAEIVVLIRRGEEIFGQIDIDSDDANVFGEEDERLLVRVSDLLATRF